MVVRYRRFNRVTSDTVILGHHSQITVSSLKIADKGPNRHAGADEARVGCPWALRV